MAEEASHTEMTIHCMPFAQTGHLWMHSAHAEHAASNVTTETWTRLMSRFALRHSGFCAKVAQTTSFFFLRVYRKTKSPRRHYM